MIRVASFAFFDLSNSFNAFAARSKPVGSNVPSPLPPEATAGAATGALSGVLLHECKYKFKRNYPLR